MPITSNTVVATEVEAEVATEEVIEEVNIEKEAM